MTALLRLHTDSRSAAGAIGFLRGQGWSGTCASSLPHGHVGVQALCKRINADEAVAIGAAIHAANLTMTQEQKSNSKLENLTLMV